MAPHKKKAHQPLQALVSSTAQLANSLLGESSTGPKRLDHAKLPWGSWELNAEFFRALSRWTITNPETSLDRLLDQISRGLENNKNLFQLIPDSPFPARGLVIALAHLLKLGVETSQAKKEIQAFSKEIIQWVGFVKSEFESSEDGEFTGRVWHNLAVLRDLVDEICLWAVNRLEDKGWWRGIFNARTVLEEIQEFKGRIEGARKLFMDLSAINQAKGFDRNQKALKRLEELQAEKLKAEERERFLAEKLNPHTVSNPTYDKHGKRPCDEGTRTEILGKIRAWVNDVGSGSQNFLWLTGVPGSGKSAITASFARECKDHKILWAQYFITRTDATTTNPKMYFPSIARQLADRSPEVASAIHDALKEMPSVTDDISIVQPAALFTKSVRKASELDRNQPVVIVIDGLDETDPDRLGVTAKIFSTLFPSLEDSGNVKVFISSRTENEIQKSFIPSLNVKHVKHILLDTNNPASITDVSNYMKRNLIPLGNELGLTWDTWPGDERFGVLEQRASGLFIWGVTAVKFIQAKLQEDGREALNSVLDMLVADALNDINDLYLRVVESGLGDKPSEWALERFRRIIGTILLIREPLTVDDLAELLDLRETPSRDRVNIAHFVRRFRTILVAETDEINSGTIPRTHKSVFEFLTSPNLDAKYRVEPHRAHLEIAVQHLAHLGAAQESTSQILLPKSFINARDSWSFHLSQTDILGSKLFCADCRQLPPFPQPVSFCTLSLEPPKQMWGDQISLGSYKHASGGSPPQRTRSFDSPRFTTDSVLMFSSDADAEQLFHFRSNILTLYDLEYYPWMRTIPRKKLSELLTCHALSPVDKVVASGSRYGSIYLWDSASGTPVGIRMDNGSPVSCIDFSPDGEQIVVGSCKLCIIWNVSTRQRVGGPWTHNNWVTSVAFSGSGRRVCSTDEDRSYVIWDVNTRMSISRGNYEHSVQCLSFSPKNDDVVAFGGYDGIEILFGNSRWSDKDTGFVRCLRFAPDGRTIMFGTSNTIFLAAVDEDQATACIIRKGNLQTIDYHLLLALSSNLDYIANYDGYKVDIYALHHNETSLDLVPLKGSTPSILAEDGNQTLMHVLSNLEEVQSSHETTIKNRRLDGIKWYQGSDEVARSFGKMLIVTDGAIIAVGKDDVVSIWKLGM